MSELAELIKRVGEPYDPERHMADFGLDLEDADRVADFYNNGGLELDNDDTREHCAVTFVALADGSVDIGCWVWKYGDDFDEDAEWHILDPAAFYDFELKAINDKIEEIYGTD